MEGQFINNGIGEGGKLYISVTNIEQFKALIKQAETESQQLEQTITQLKNFEIALSFDVGNKCGIESANILREEEND